MRVSTRFHFRARSKTLPVLARPRLVHQFANAVGKRARGAFAAIPAFEIIEARLRLPIRILTNISRERGRWYLDHLVGRFRRRGVLLVRNSRKDKEAVRRERHTNAIEKTNAYTVALHTHYI